MSVTKLTPKNSEDFLQANKDAFIVLVFDAEYTGQDEVVQGALKCLTASPELQDKISVGLVDAEQNNDLTARYSIVSVPIIIGVSKRGQVKKIDTFEPSKLLNIIQDELRRIEMFDNEDAPAGDPKERFKEYLRKLTNKAPIMVFMKGDPKAPRCGFSKQLVELLSKYDVEYETFDILQDDEVRQGLKEYSDWPTYPQVYVKGEFIGGLDILKQMAESDELKSVLQSALAGEF